MTHPAYPPVEWVRLKVDGSSFKPRFSTGIRSIVSEVALADGSMDRLKIDNPMLDLSLALPDGSLSEDAMRRLQHIMARGVPVVVYSPWASSAKLLAPLSEAHLSTAGTLTEIGTTQMNLLLADSGRGLCSGAGAFFLDGVQTGLGQSSPFPLGTGMLAHSRVYNLLDGETWSITGGTGTPTTEDRASWLNEDQTCMVVYTDGGDAVLESSAFTVVAGETYCVAVAYHSDGEVAVIVNWPTGHTTTTVDNHLQGSGFLVGYVTVPAGETTATLQLKQTSGKMSMWAVPGVYYILEGSTHRAARDVRQIWNDTTDLSHSMAIENLTVGPHLWESGLVCVSGYCQPGWSIPNGTHTTPARPSMIATLADETNDNQLGIGFAYKVGDGKTYLGISYNSTYTYEELTLAHTLGDAYFFMLYFGQTALGADIAAAKVVNLSTGVATTVESLASDIVPIFDSLVVGAKWGTIGTASGMTGHFDGLIGGVSIHGIAYSDLSAFAAYHSDAGVIDLKALTNGRMYKLDMSVSPSPFKRQYYGGSLDLTQIGRL